MQTDTTRRALLDTARLLATVAPSSAAGALAHPASDAIEGHYAAWRAGHRRLELDPVEDIDGPELAPVWAAVDADEVAILNADEATPRVAEIRLWVSLHHHFLKREHCAAVINEDLATLMALEPSLDWPQRLTVGALRALVQRGA